MADSAPEIDENPYIGVANRKSRNLKKKLDKIFKAEAQLKQGKALNEEQLILLSSKASVERALTDIESIKSQLEEVARELAKEALQADNVKAVSMDVSVATETAVIQVAVSTQVEKPAESEPQPVAKPSAAAVAAPQQPGFDAKFVQNLVNAQVQKLLRTLHVCSRYQAITDTPLPADVDYFGKCLLGQTSLGDFQDALQQSVRNASLFLDPVQGAQHEAIRGMSYSELSAFIDELAGHLDIGSSGDVDALLNGLTSPIAPPEINFFAAVESSSAEPIVDTDGHIEEQPISAEQAVNGVAKENATAGADAARGEREPRNRRRDRERPPRRADGEKPPRNSENRQRRPQPQNADGLAAPTAASAVTTVAVTAGAAASERKRDDPWGKLSSAEVATVRPSAPAAAGEEVKPRFPRADRNDPRGPRPDSHRGEPRGPRTEGTGRGGGRRTDSRPEGGRGRGSARGDGGSGRGAPRRENKPPATA